ncbi:hypothetical protein U3A58_13630 [Algoriphagus sp. C2-6-M1]|uniref:hypothetical protein n=1 Tax=Algoriphagus persicinus TaxID=3108754 RepID=UPI002B3E0C45|nr:hypothetical protein [Algoriphagus sp. C2-6-M1]MEB2781436.1 hypothetical protein [Algoriphagus sp. C2-6-M1]
MKEFSKEYLERFGLTAKTADDFITDTIDLNTDLALEAFRALVLNRTNPNLDEYEILDRFRKNGLVDSANYLHALL